MVQSLAAGREQVSHFFRARQKSGVCAQVALTVLGICPSRDGTIPSAEAGSWCPAIIRLRREGHVNYRFTQLRHGAGVYVLPVAAKNVPL